MKDDIKLSEHDLAVLLCTQAEQHEGQRGMRDSFTDRRESTILGYIRRARRLIKAWQS